jgi:hypothetical protein
LWRIDLRHVPPEAPGVWVQEVRFVE